METFLFDKMAENEDRHWWFRGRREVLISVMRRYLPRRDSLRLLDVGCGTGFMMEAMRQFGEVEGVETSAEARAYCRRRLGDDAVLHEKPLPAGLPAGRRFNVVTAFDVIEHIESPVEALQAISDVLEPDGVFFASVPAFMFLWSSHDEVNHHFRRYDRRMLTDELLRGGLQPIFTSYFNSALFPAVAAVRVASRLLPARKHVSDLDEPPNTFVNTLLETLFAAERRVVPVRALPFGVSLLAVARKA